MNAKDELTQLMEDAIAERVSASIIAEEILDKGFVRKQDFIKEIRQIVIEDVPHQYQNRLLKIK